MLTSKYLCRSRRRIAASGPAGAAYLNSMRSRLDRVARFSPDEAEAATSAHALAVLAGHQWRDSAFDVLGVPAPRRPPKPVGPLGSAR